jgi:medium-chain acyl-[acyl-carrier-protein] hydrolase
MPSPWHRDPDPAARVRLVCLPWAGAGTVDYRAWTPRASAHGVDVLPICLPGREGRIAEAPFRAMSPLVEALVPAVRALATRPYALFGHSMGAWIGAALLQRLVTAGVPLPVRFFASGRRAPHVPDRLGALHPLPDAAFISALQERYQAMPAQLLARPDVLAMFLPALRADFTLLETWAPREAVLPVPLSVWAGASDTTLTEAELRAWSRWTGREVTPRTFPGGHFYLKEPAVRDAVVDAVVADLR